ncbi:hypothetical protein BASA62_007539 [Batrachochytrium salamandrivorans]|nr:hypothetical protein BASA62_007539 [Batrachochytrium salamandrivorans]
MEIQGSDTDSSSEKQEVLHRHQIDLVRLMIRLDPVLKHQAVVTCIVHLTINLRKDRKYPIVMVQVPSAKNPVLVDASRTPYMSNLMAKTSVLTRLQLVNAKDVKLERRVKAIDASIIDYKSKIEVAKKLKEEIQEIMKKAGEFYSAQYTSSLGLAKP